MRYIVIGIVWLALALALGASGSMQRLRPPAPQMVLVALSVLVIVATRVSRELRAWLVGLGWRPVVAYHLVRFIGAYFLYLYGRGELPREWAVPSGYGDILVASLSALLLLAGRAVDRRPALLLLWNLIGLADILMVVVTAARLALGTPGSMDTLLHLPLSLLLTFIVPLVIASHVWMFELVRSLPGDRAGAVAGAAR